MEEFPDDDAEKKCKYSKNMLKYLNRIRGVIEKSVQHGSKTLGCF
jgi:hypothetical protein